MAPRAERRHLKPSLLPRHAGLEQLLLFKSLSLIDSIAFETRGDFIPAKGAFAHPSHGHLAIAPLAPSVATTASRTFGRRKAALFYPRAAVIWGTSARLAGWAGTLRPRKGSGVASAIASLPKAAAAAPSAAGLSRSAICKQQGQQSCSHPFSPL